MVRWVPITGQDHWQATFREPFDHTAGRLHDFISTCDGHCPFGQVVALDVHQDKCRVGMHFHFFSIVPEGALEFD